MSSWRECKLGEILELKYGKDHKALNDGNIPVFGSGGIMRYADTFLYDDESILIPRKGTLNNIFYINEPFWTVDTIFWSKINKKEAFGKFLFYQLKTIDFANLNVGSAVPSLTTKVLNEVDISLPPLEEQKAIAEVLSSLDDKIDLLHRQNHTLESIAGTLFRQWFIEEAKEEWEIKFSDAPIQIIDGDRGNNYPKNSDFFTNEYCLFLSARNVTKNGFDFVDCQFITKERDELLRKGKLSRYDVVLTTRGTVGNIAYYHELIPFENIRINSGMVILRADETKISSLYLYILMKSPLFTESVIEHTSGSAQPQLPIRDLNNVSFILPPKNIYYKFMEQVKPIYSKVFSNQKQIQTLENLRDTLLPKLLSGEVRIKCL